MESQSCIACGSKEQEFLLQGPDRLLNRPGSYCLVRCRLCGLIFQPPSSAGEGESADYPDHYLPYRMAVEEEPSFWRRWDRGYALWKRYRLLSCFVPEAGRILDYGCATGLFLDFLRKRGWLVAGTEPNPSAAGYARDRFGLKILSEGISRRDLFPAASFDAATLWDVLEHVPNPVDLLQNLSCWIRTGGYLFLTVPDPESWERSLFGRYWVGWDLPRHRFLFPRSVLDRLLGENGFAIQKTLCFTGRYHTFLMSLDWLLREKWSSPSARKILLSILRSWPLRLLGLAFFKVSDQLSPSTSLTVVARKTG